MRDKGKVSLTLVNPIDWETNTIHMHGVPPLKSNFGMLVKHAILSMVAVPPDGVSTKEAIAKMEYWLTNLSGWKITDTSPPCKDLEDLEFVEFCIY